MKILLIRPNSGIVKTPPPLGLMYIAGYIRNKMPVEIKIVDARRGRLDEAGIRKVVEQFGPDIVGITGLHFESIGAHAIAKIAKSLNKVCIVVLGGPYASSDYAGALKDASIDYCVVGEGEESFYELAKSISEGNRPDGLGGIAYRVDSGYLYQPRSGYIKDLDMIPHPAWDLVSLEQYFDSRRLSIGNPLQVEERAVPVFTSRGCPFGCYYCHDIFGKVVRFRSPENVLDELQYLISRYGVKEIEIIDDVFNINKERAKKICDLIIEKGLRLKINFGNGLRADIMDEELLGKLKKAGAYRIIYGIESGSSRIQGIIGKKLNLARTKEIIAITAKKGISVGGFFMMGFNTETKEEILETIEFAKHSRLHTASFYYVKPFPGTKLNVSIKKEGLDYNSPSFSSYNTLSDNLSCVTDKELKDLKRKAYREFYINISRVMDIFKTTPNKLGLVRNVFSTARLMVKDTMAN
ncbi:MAG: radical SAM protein [Candidatus Omnitrophota bacterium]